MEDAWKDTIRNLLGQTKIINVVKDFVDEGLLKDGDMSLITNADSDAKVLDMTVTRLTPHLVDIKCLRCCLSVIANHGVCIPFNILPNDVGGTECLRKIAASFESAVKAMKSQHESYISPLRLPGNYVHHNPDTTSESTKVTTGNRSKELFIESANANIRNPSNEFAMQCRGNETKTEPANASIGNTSNESLLQSSESETVNESANANTVNGINNVPMQLIEQKSSGESFEANVDNCRDFHPGTGIEDIMAVFEETQETVQGAVGSEPEIHIIGNWKFLKENINPDYIRDYLISTELIDSDDCDGTGYDDKSRQRKIDHLLTCVVRNIGSTSDLEKFINIFETDQQFIADKIKLPIKLPDWSKGVKNVENSNRLHANRKLIEEKLRKPHTLFDDFLENGVFDIDDHEKLCKLTGKRKKMAECFMDKVLDSVKKGSYDLLLHILKKEMCNGYQTIVDALEKKPDQSAPEISVCIKLKSGKLYKSNEDNTPRTDGSEDGTFTITIKGDERCENLFRENPMKLATHLVKYLGALPTHVTDGSVVIHLKSVDGDIISRLTDSIRKGQFARLIEELLTCQDAKRSIPSGHCSVDFIIELDNSSSEKQLPATLLKFKVKNSDQRIQLLPANKAFLQEEIDPLTLLEAFSKKGFDHFKEANIKCIPERRLRTDKFLDILEKESDQLMDVFIEILEDKKMNFVVKRLRLYKKIQLIDAALLRKNIIKHIESIVDEVDLEDIKDEIISRCGLHGYVIEELHSQYPEGSEGRIVAMIVDILGQGDSAVFMFIDVLFNSGIDSSLLEELSDIEQVSDDIDCVDDNAIEVIREVPKRGLIFQCEVEVTVEVKVTTQTFDLTPDMIARTKAKLLETENQIDMFDSVLSKKKEQLLSIRENLQSQATQIQKLDNRGVPLFPVDKWDICHGQMNLISEQLDTFWNRDTRMIEHQHEMSEKHDKSVTQDDTVTSLEKCSAGSNYQLQSNDLSDDSRTGLMHDKSEDLGNVIQDNNPKIKSEHVKCVSKVNQTISDGMKIPEQVPTTDENLTEVSDTEAIDPTPSISQPLFRSHSQSHYFKRQFSKSELLPKVTIKTLDGNIKHVKERRVTTDSEGNLQLFVPPGQTMGSSENSEDNDIRCIPAYRPDKINKGACSKIKVTDNIGKNMTDKNWKDLCQHEAEKGSKLTLEQLPQVCAPDTILLLDISGGMKDNGYKELKDAAVDFVNKRIATREELDLNENIAMVTYGHMTEVRHHLTSDYDIVLKQLDNLPEPGGLSPMIAGLQLCQSVIAARGKISMIGGRQEAGRHVGGSRFHPRIVLISDGNLTPSDCIIGNTNLPDLNTGDKEEEIWMIGKLYDICRELSNSKTQVVCIPVGCFDKERLEFIANITGGKIVNHRKAASLGNERAKMVYAKEIEEGKMSENDLKSKLLSMRTITADDFDDIIDISKNPSKYGIIDDDDDDDDGDDELLFLYLQILFE